MQTLEKYVEWVQILIQKQDKYRSNVVVNIRKNLFKKIKSLEKSLGL